MARLGDHVELSTSRFLKCRERLSRSTPSSHKIFSSDGDQLLESERLIHKCIWRYIDKAPYAGFTGNARIIPRVCLPHPLSRCTPAVLRFFGCRIILQHKACDVS